jgi:hypothetical protein
MKMKPVSYCGRNQDKSVLCGRGLVMQERNVRFECPSTILIRNIVNLVEDKQREPL